MQQDWDEAVRFWGPPNGQYSEKDFHRFLGYVRKPNADFCRRSFSEDVTYHYNQYVLLL